MYTFHKQLQFRREKDDTPRYLVPCIQGMFVENQLVKVNLSKIDKRLLDLVLPKNIMEFGGQATLAKAFAIVEHCDCALC